jgi:hypothetical protein
MWIETRTTFSVTVLDNLGRPRKKLQDNIKVEHRLGGLEVDGNGSVTLCRLLALALLNFNVILPKFEFLVSCFVLTHLNLTEQCDQLESFCTE